MYGSFLPYRFERRILLVFSYTDGWWASILPGYTHVAMATILDDDFIVAMEPTLVGGNVLFRTLPGREEWSGFRVLELVVRPTRKNRLIRPIIQTCATMVQYWSGFWLGAYTVQGLYRELMGCRKGLRHQGIMEVREWV